MTYFVVKCLLRTAFGQTLDLSNFSTWPLHITQIYIKMCVHDCMTAASRDKYPIQPHLITHSPSTCHCENCCRQFDAGWRLPKPSFSVSISVKSNHLCICIDSFMLGLFVSLSTYCVHYAYFQASSAATYHTIVSAVCCIFKCNPG